MIHYRDADLLGLFEEFLASGFIFKVGDGSLAVGDQLPETVHGREVERLRESKVYSVALFFRSAPEIAQFKFRIGRSQTGPGFRLRCIRLRPEHLERCVVSLHRREDRLQVLSPKRERGHYNRNYYQSLSHFLTSFACFPAFRV